MDEDYKTQITVKIPSKKLLNNNEKSTNVKDDKLTSSSSSRKDEKSNNRKEEKSNRREHTHRNRDDKLKEEREDEKKRWKLKFEQIQTQLSRTEIQMYDYKEKLNDLIKENLNLKENLENKIQQLEDKLTNKNIEYLNLNDQYNKLKNNLINDEESIDFNELLTDNIDNNNQNDNKLNQVKQLIETNRSLKELNEQLRKEIKNLENELEESSDKYREDQSNEYKDLKFKLENTIKNNRLLQFKLTKLERSYNQIKVENHHLTNKLKKAVELTNLRNRPLTPQTEITKNELDKAKEVLLRMHISLQTLKGEKKQLEDQLNLTKTELLSMSLRNQQQQQQLNKSKNRALSPQSSIENKNLEEKILDLEERESDLQEQLKFSEQESDSLRKKLQLVEQENEILTKQIQNLCNTNDEISKDNSIEKIVILKLEQDEQLIQLKKELEDEKSKNEELDKKLQELKESKEFIRRGSGELIRRDSGEIIRRSSNEFINKEQNLNRKENYTNDDDDQKNRSTNSISLNNAFNLPKVEKVLQKEIYRENLKSGSLFYEEKIENLERQLQKIKNDLNEKQQENENLVNLIELKRKFGKGRSSMIRSASLDEN